MKLYIFVCLCMQFSLINCYILEPGPVFKATQGEIWPKPFQQKMTDFFSIIRPDLLNFKIQHKSCDILNDAIKRYKQMIKRMMGHEQSNIYGLNDEELFSKFQNNSHFTGFMDEITINLQNECEGKPHPDMLEEYKLTVESTRAYLNGSIWGILRGLETFSQLIFPSADRTVLLINATSIHDRPRYSHRGLLVDTSRHFISMSTLKQILDGMAYNKLNVFHWHIVDDHSFPYESVAFPELSRQGAYTSSRTYSQRQIKEIIEYARLRGIRTMAEFDTPGHTRSWGISHPEILTKCEGKYANKLGPIDPTKEESYTFMQKLLKEVVSVFPDEYVHLGGDEVGFECWQSSSKIRDFMKARQIHSYEKLEELYIQRIVNMVEKLAHKSIVWQEVFQNGVKLAPETVVQIWTGSRSTLLYNVTHSGYRAILSTCWYLDQLSNGGDWQKFYACDPSDFPGTEQQHSLVIGGTACMWSEAVDNTNILQRIFPRVSATAEKLWSQQDVMDRIDAGRRLEEHTCRMRSRGIPAQPPNGPGFCR